MLSQLPKTKSFHEVNVVNYKPTGRGRPRKEKNELPGGISPIKFYSPKKLPMKSVSVNKLEEVNERVTRRKSIMPTESKFFS